MPADPDLLALHDRLRAALLGCYAYVHDPYGKFGFAAHNELVALNSDLEAVRRINAGLGHLYHAPAVAAWPVPVFRENVLMGPRDVLGALQTATRVTRTAIEIAEAPVYA